MSALPGTEPARAQSRNRAGLAAGARYGPWAFVAILLLATANFFWQLGASSYYVDEALSIDNALPSIGSVVHLVNQTESNPWTYFLALHEWLGRTGSEREWVTRLPSAVAGIALVTAVFWLARAFLPRTPALVAAALAALSPLVLQYAQEVRVYVFVMLALALAVALVVRAPRAGRAATRLLLLAAVASVAALWLHYAAILVVGPLCVWLARQASLTKLQRWAFVGVCAVGEVLMIPLFIEQYRNSGGLAGIANFTLTNVVTVGGTPFDGRFVSGLTPVRILALLVVAVSAWVVWTRRDARIHEPRLLCALALVPVAVVLLLGLLGKDVVSTRYTAVAAPLFLVIIAAGLSTLPRLPAAGLAIAAAFASGWGLVVSHSRAGFYPPSRQTMAFIAAHRRPGDLVAIVAHGGVQWPYELYGRQLLHPPPRYIEPGDRSRLLAALRRRERIWIITETVARHTSPGAFMRTARPLLARFGYRPVTAQALTTTWTSIAYLIVPAPT